MNCIFDLSSRMERIKICVREVKNRTTEVTQPEQRESSLKSRH